MIINVLKSFLTPAYGGQERLRGAGLLQQQQQSLLEGQEKDSAVIWISHQVKVQQVYFESQAFGVLLLSQVSGSNSRQRRHIYIYRQHCKKCIMNTDQIVSLKHQSDVTSNV